MLRWLWSTRPHLCLGPVSPFLASHLHLHVASLYTCNQLVLCSEPPSLVTLLLQVAQGADSCVENVHPLPALDLARAPSAALDCAGGTSGVAVVSAPGHARMHAPAMTWNRLFLSHAAAAYLMYS